jgi:chromosome segregation ATPase
MSQLAPLVLFGLFGAVMGTVLTWFFMHRIGQAAVSQARSDGQIEGTRQSERLAAVTAELNEYKAKAIQSGAEHEQLRDQLNRIRDDRSRLEEHTNRLSTVEAELLDCKSALSAIRDENSALTAQLSDRNHMLDDLTKRLAESEMERKANQESAETLQTRLQEESNRVATLTQQSTRVPELERVLSESVTEKQRVEGLLSEVREKYAASLSTVDNQRQQIARLEEKHARLETKCDQYRASSNKPRLNLPNPQLH